MYNDDIEYGRRKFECSYNGYTIFAVPALVGGSNLVSYQCHGFMDETKLDKLKQAIDEKIQDDQKNAEQRVKRLAETLKDEERARSQKTIRAALVGGLGFAIAGPIGAMIGVAIGSVDDK